MFIKKIFDIAPSNVFEVVDENSIQFLINQRSGERIGFIANIKTKYDDDDDNFDELHARKHLEKRRKKSNEEKALLGKL